jgi:RNA polymerase sigma-70 factor (ECF subfamily)
VKDDARDFDRFARPHAAAALQLARTLVRNEADAQDVLQDSFLRAFRYFRTFSGESPRAWLLSIVRNVGYTLWRKRSREPWLEDPAEPGANEDQEIDDAPSPEARLLQACDADLVRHGLSRLPLAYREVLVLREMEDCSYREIASILEVPIGTVMSRLARGRAQLVRELVGVEGRKN